MRRAERVWLAAAAGLVATLFLSGCGDDSKDDDGGGEADIALVSADQVGGTALPTAETEITASSPCGLDDSDQWVGASDENTRAFERDVDGVTEKLVIGVTEREQEYVQSALDSLRQALDRPDCRAGQSDPPGDRWTSELVPDLGSDTVAFRSIVTIGAGDAASEEDAAAQGRHSHLRAYRQVGDNMVFVWLERTGDTDPSVDDLRRLLEEQTALTKKDA